MIDYSHTKARTLQWIGIILIIGVFAGAYYYFKVSGSTLNKSPTSSITSGLVGYWTFDGADVSGTSATDRSGAGNTGTLTNGPIRGIGKIGQALSFDGINDYVDVGRMDSLEEVKQVTLSLWVKPNSLSDYQGILAKSLNSSNEIAIFSGATSDVSQSAVLFTVRNGSNSYGRTGSGVLAIGRWVHLVGVFDGNQIGNDNRLKIYVNGVKQPLTFVGTIPVTTPSIANNLLLGWPFSGSMDEARLYDRALLANEIESLYNLGQSDKTNSSVSQPQGTGRLDSGLAAYFALDEGSGTSTTDSSTNGNTGTLTNGPTWTTGQIGSAVEFDGTNDYINIPDSNDSKYTGAITLCTWARIDTGSNYHLFMSKNTGVANAPFEFRTDNNATPGLELVRSNSDYTIAIGPQATLGVWKHYCVVAPPQIQDPVTFYIDGIPSVSSSVLGTGTGIATGSGADIRIGTRPDGAVKMDGAMDEVRIYSRALPKDEIEQLYRLTTPTGVDTSLEGYWSLNGQDVSGMSAYDRSGAGNTGTLTNGPIRGIGKIGQALSFDGINDYVDVGDMASLEGVSQVTLSTWVKPSSLSAIYLGLISKQSSLTSDMSLISGGPDLGDSSHVAFVMRNGSDSYGYTIDPGNLVVGQWTHVVGIFDGSGSDNSRRLSIYVNGNKRELTFSGTIPTTTPANSTNMTLGLSGSYYFSGTIDESRTYSRALSLSEVRALYNQGR